MLGNVFSNRGQNPLIWLAPYGIIVRRKQLPVKVVVACERAPTFDLRSPNLGKEHSIEKLGNLRRVSAFKLCNLKDIS